MSMNTNDGYVDSSRNSVFSALLLLRFVLADHETAEVGLSVGWVAR